jgi:dienelactone hydrolase
MKIPKGWIAAVILWQAGVTAALCPAAEVQAGGAARPARTNLLIYPTPAGAFAPVRTTADWQIRRAAILRAMQQIMGPLPGAEKRCALEPTQTGEDVDCGSYVRRSITYLAEPGGRVPAYLLVPKRVLTNQVRAPAVLALHQTHAAGQKVVVGLGQSTNDEYGVELAERGFVVLAPPYTMLANYRPDFKALGYASGTMKSIWDNMRGLDYLSTLPFVRTNGFGTIGHSLGGHNSVFTAVFDERIQAVVSSCGLDAFVDYYGGDPAVWKPERGWCQERYMPRLAEYAGRLEEIPFDFPELIGALAPRACFISAPQGDTNFRWQSVDIVARSAREVYRLYGKPDRLRVEHPDCAHLFPRAMREEAYRWLEDHLR